jgi:hypothetical protein
MNNLLKRVIVAGGGGFIGRALCGALLAGGYQVVVLTRGPSRNPIASPDGLQPMFVNWDGRTSRGWGHLADGAFALVNLAGENIARGRWTPKRKQAIAESRVLPGLAMLQAASEASVRPEVYVQASAVGFYGDTGAEVVDEAFPPGRFFLSRVCLEVEASTREMETMGARRVVIRTGLVLGRGGGVLQKMIMPFDLFLGGPFGNGRQGFPWIHLDDVTGAIVFLLENPAASGPYNLTAPEGVSNLEFCRHLGRALSRPCWLAVPPAALRLMFGEMAEEMFLTGCRAAPRRLMDMGYAFRHPGLAEALAALFPRTRPENSN